MFSQSPIDYMLFGKPESHKIERKEKKEEGTRKVKEDQAQREAERLRKIEADRKMRTGLKSGLIAQQMLARKHVENALSAVRTRLQNAMDDVRVVGEIAKDIDAMCDSLIGGALAGSRTQVLTRPAHWMAVAACMLICAVVLVSKAMYISVRTHWWSCDL